VRVVVQTSNLNWTPTNKQCCCVQSRRSAFSRWDRTKKPERLSLIAGTNRDLKNDVRAGRFREDLLARINHWTFRLPALRDRSEDIEPNIDYELDRHTQRSSPTVRFNAEARRAFIRFATSPEALWTGNFRELSAAIARMATLADGGRITERLVMDEIARLKEHWVEPSGDILTSLLPTATLEELDAFDRLQLESVVAVCRRSKSLLDEGPKGSGKLSVERFDVQDNVQIFGGPKLKSRLFHRQRRGRTAN